MRTSTLGADLRSLRKTREITLSDLAARLNRSVGWLSQVERDISEPSVEELRQLARELSVPVSIFFGQAEAPAEEQGFVVRKEARRQLRYGAGGLTEELLSPDLTDDFEMFHTTVEAGAAMEQFDQRPTQEVGYLMSGRLNLWIGDQEYKLNAGDSFRIRGEKFKWANPYDQPAVAIWVIAPPIY